MMRGATHSGPASRYHAGESTVIAGSGGQLFDETSLRAEILSLFQEAQYLGRKKPSARPVFSKLLPEEFPEYGGFTIPPKQFRLSGKDSEIREIHAQLCEEIKRTA